MERTDVRICSGESLSLSLPSLTTNPADRQAKQTPPTDSSKPEKDSSRTGEKVARKRSKERQEQDQSEVSPSSSGNEENDVTAAEPAVELPVKKGRGRPRKYAAGMTAAAKVIKRATKNGAVKVAGVNEPRRPGRPPKKSTELAGGETRKSQLEMLHEQTLLSINNRTGKRLSPAPGCVDSKLSSTDVDPTGVPSVIITDSSDLSVGEKLDRIMDIWKQEMQQFLSHMQ